MICQKILSIMFSVQLFQWQETNWLPLKHTHRDTHNSLHTQTLLGYSLSLAAPVLWTWMSWAWLDEGSHVYPVKTVGQRGESQREGVSQGTWVRKTRSSCPSPRGAATSFPLSEIGGFSAINGFTPLVFLPSFLHILSSQSVALPALERALQSALLSTLSVSAPLNLLGFLPSQASAFLLANQVDLPLCDFFSFSIKLSYIYIHPFLFLDFCCSCSNSFIVFLYKYISSSKAFSFIPCLVSILSCSRLRHVPPFRDLCKWSLDLHLLISTCSKGNLFFHHKT